MSPSLREGMKSFLWLAREVFPFLVPSFAIGTPTRTSHVQLPRLLASRCPLLRLNHESLTKLNESKMCTGRLG